MIEYIFQRILLLSLSGALITAILLPIIAVTKKIFSSKWRYYTCAMALLVFLIPLSFKLPLRDIEKDVTNDKIIVFKFNEVQQQDRQSILPAAKENTSTSNLDLSAVYKYVFFVWLFGCAFCLTFTVISHLNYVKHLRSHSTHKDCKEALESFGCERLTVLKSDAISSPQLIGIIKPTLFIPDIKICNSDLNNILRHECIHCKRFDIAVKWLCVIAKSIHWFNPFVYLLIQRIDIECEISCDISALQGLDKIEIQSYCETILSLITHEKSNVSPQLCMGDTKKNLERRFKAIMEEKRKSKKTVIISAIVATAIVLLSLTTSAVLGGYAQKENTKDKEFPTKNNGTADSAVASQANLTNSPVVIYKVPKADDEIAVLKVGTVNDAENSTARVHPVTGEKIAEDFSIISHGFDSEKHPAVDYRLEAGTAISSPMGGTITVAEYASDKGNHIEIEGNDGTTRVIFAHLEKMYVSEGDKVNAGDTVGTVGSTGRSTGPHLHVEYYENGEAVNPVEVFITEENGEILAVNSKPEQIID